MGGLVGIYSSPSIIMKLQASRRFVSSSSTHRVAVSVYRHSPLALQLLPALALGGLDHGELEAAVEGGQLAHKALGLVVPGQVHLQRALERGGLLRRSRLYTILYSMGSSLKSFISCKK